MAAEKLFRARAWLRTMLWLTETEEGHRQLFETSCEVEREKIRDDRALAVLRAELQADFAADGVVDYAVAFPARATTMLWPSALHLDIERRQYEVVAIEAHAADAHLRAHRAIVQVGGVAGLAALGPIELAPAARFGALIAM